MNQEIVFIGLGSNVGDRQNFCDRAIALMSLLPDSQLTGVSSYYETEPIDPASLLSSTWFYNCVIRIKTKLTPINLLEICQETERSLGRDPERCKGPRTIDLDILFYGQGKFEQPGLTIPHPRLHLRRFVLAPLAELDPEWNHPTFNQSVRELIDSLDDPHQVKKSDVVPGSSYGAHQVYSPS